MIDLILPAWAPLVILGVATVFAAWICITDSKRK